MGRRKNDTGNGAHAARNRGGAAESGTAASRPRTTNINLQSMEVFCEVVRLRGFSRGGAVFGISQSAVSQIVAHLESEVGTELIDRTRRPLVPTPEGREYARRCQEILHRHGTVLDDLRRGADGVGGTVRVASIYSVGLHTLDRFLQQFMKRYPAAAVHLEYCHPVKVYSAVLDDEADIGVISYPEPQRGLEVTPWLDEEMVIACPVGHALSSGDRLELTDLEGQKFVAFARGLKIRRELDRALRTLHVSVKVVSEFDNIETIKQALEVTGAVSILPRPSIRREVERGTLAEVPLDGEPLVRPVAIISKRRRRMTTTTRLFVESLLGAGNDSARNAGVRDGISARLDAPSRSE